ncbi:MAG TPA: Qat anti-phage system TatD family nuclease QatD [Gemmataceae bacterium]|jgi:TatD DNase family protein
MPERRMCLVDAHCHLDLYKDPVALLRRIEAAGVCTIAVTNAPSVFFHTQKLAGASRFIRPAVGLHPELITTHAHERPLFWSELSKTRFVGEVGLDYVTSDHNVRSLQREVFREILERCAETGDKVLTVHSRRAASDVIDMVGANYRGAVILHWFSGSGREADRARANKLYFSVNPAMVRSKAGQALIQRMDPEYVLTETDGPFVTLGKEPAEPPDVLLVVRYLAAAWRLQENEVRAKLYANFTRLAGDAGRLSG